MVFICLFDTEAGTRFKNSQQPAEVGKFLQPLQQTLKAESLFCHQKHTNRESGHYVMAAFTRPLSFEDDSGVAEPLAVADLVF